MAKMNRKKNKAPDVEPLKPPRFGLPYPLWKLPKQGVVVGMQGGRIIPPLTPAEYAQAIDLRQAALAGDDFRGMMASIEEAGFRIRPKVSIKEEGIYNLAGISFTRGGITVTASGARMRFDEDAENPRAPRMGRDGPFLLRMRAAYDRDHAVQIEARKTLLADIRTIENASGHFLEAAPLLIEAGITAAEQFDRISIDGAERQRRLLSLQRDGAEVRAIWASFPTVWKATNHLLEQAAKAAIQPQPQVTEDEPERATIEP